MVAVRQHTLRRAVEASGIGLHSAQAVRLVLRPAGPDTGIVFRRVDLSPVVDIPARARFVSDTHFATTLHHHGVSVTTVEHLLAALLGLEVDNAVVELNAGEVPVMDGSAAPFVQLIEAAGREAQPQLRRFLRIRREVAVSDGDKTASFTPHTGFRLSFAIEFDEPLFAGLPAQSQMDFSTGYFTERVSPARTFGFLGEVEQLRARGLALGGSLENAIVVDGGRILNEGGLRSEDEFVQHKVLDAMGDLSLIGYPLLGEYRAFKAGHTLNHRAIEALLETPAAWDLVTCDQGWQASGADKNVVS